MNEKDREGVIRRDVGKQESAGPRTLGTDRSPDEKVASGQHWRGKEDGGGED